ncbi:acyclic terpene utilization AtuA family protein [Pseudonocardia sp. GCM10023141]|uniref:acyclic terpene utilization AtuA family protein n=1 Tax=Pseudonocardia sp. GCM10023141 TaxID=3252653 RepID=UPI0036183639
MSRRPVRIANFSGYLGDRFSALSEVLAGDPVDVLVGDYLAEITLAALAARSPEGGYVGYALAQLQPHLPVIAERGLKVVTNAGGFRPEALAAALREHIAAAGLALRVAHIEGDNLLPHLDELRAAGHPFTHLDTGAPLSSWGVEPAAANAYLGGAGIAAALQAGADIVIAGRVTDASLTSGPAAWWHGWSTDAWNELAGAVLAGHVIECGPHATGGNFSGFASIPRPLRLGYPIAEVAADGSSVITKHVADGGAVTVDTVTAQLVYEIQGPHYLNPDVTVHLEDTVLTLEAPDRVRICGTTGTPPPPTAKIALFAPLGYQMVMTTFATAPDVEAKVALLRAQLHEQFGAPEQGIDELEVVQLGVPAADPETEWEATVAVRIIATARDREVLSRGRFAAHVHALFLASYPGFFTDTAATPVHEPRARIGYWPALLPAAVVAHDVVLDDATVIAIPVPAASSPANQPVHPEPEPLPGGPTRRLPLGTVAHARSGDKGANANVGVWVSDERAWPWLRSLLTVEEVRRLVPDAKDLDIVRHELPHLRAVHLVLRGLLAPASGSTLRVDQAAKSVGEHLRARLVDIPEELLS